ncbi:MAG: hypothetical protein H7Y11_00470, partial [Armatimonadetes bacterium]|nr:hypothetical protein [Anaerolineae bacterium]
DLEIRGAGDILSTRQTGQVAAIGLHLYTQLLTQAIQERKGRAEGEAIPAAATSSVILDLPLPAYLPDDWIPELSLRLQIYRRIASLNTQDEVDAMRDELRDRFGQLPPAVEGLLYQIEVKLLAQRAGASAVVTRKDTLHLKLPYLPEINRTGLARWLGGDVVVSRVAVELPINSADDWQPRLLDVLARLAENTSINVLV